MVVRLKDLEGETKKSSLVRLKDLGVQKPTATQYGYSMSDRSTEKPYRPVEKEVKKTQKKNIILDIANSMIKQGKKNIESVTEGRETVLGSPLAPREALTMPDPDSSIAEKLKFSAKVLPRFATDPIAEIGAQVYMPGAGMGVVNNAYQGAGNLISKIAPKLANSRTGRVAEEVLKDVAVSAPIEFGYAAKNAEDNKELLKQTAIGTGIGAGLGGLISGVVEGVQAMRRPVRLADLQKVAPTVETPLEDAIIPTQSAPVDKATATKNFEDYVDSLEMNKRPDDVGLSDEELSKYRELESAMNESQVAPTIEPKVTRLADMKPDVVQPKPIPNKNQSQLDELESVYQSQVETVKKGGLHPEDMSKQLKGMAMRHSAEKRKLVQGDSLIKVDGGLTDKELADVIKRERSNYSGKAVTVNGQDGVITKNAFGKVGVQFADGEIKFFDPDSIKPKVDVDELIKQQSAPKMVPKVVEPKPVVPKAEPSIQPTLVTPKTEPIAKPKVEPAIPKSEPKKIESSVKERGFSETLNASEKTPQGFKEKFKSMYEPITNEGTLAQANKRINADVEESTSFVLGDSRYTAEKAATAQRLIDHYNSQGNYQRAVDIAEKVSEEATKAGQGIQALSMFNKLSPEGVLVYAQRKAKKVNESIPVWSKEKKVTEDMAAQISELANATKKMTGVTDNSNNVIDILDRAKSGEKLTPSDESALRTFIKDSQEFVKETTRKNPSIKPPAIPKDKRVRDNVVSFLDKQEIAAKERLRAKGIQISSTPLDVWADYAIIGASKMGKGTIKFADWSEAMIKDLGESIRPQLRQLYERSRETFDLSTKKVTQETVSRAERLTEKLIKGKGLEGAEADSLRQLAQKVSGLSGEQKRLASQDLQQVLQALDNPTLLRKVATTQTIGQLLNPKTQVRNALGNELFYRIERINKLVATPIDIVRSKITGGQRTVTFKTNNQGEYWKNWMRGLKAGWKGVNVQGLETQYDLGSPAFTGKWNPMTYFEKALGASLKSFDTAAYMRAYNNTIGEMATLKAINQGRKGDKAFIENAIRNADDNILKIADEYGRYVTFQDNNLISKGLVKLKRGMNLGRDFGMGDLILKYPKTPGALLMRALEYSPAGFVRSAVVAARPWYKREPNTGEVMQALSRAIIGTMGLSGMGYFLMDKGILTGQASKDKDVRELQKSAGQGQYQVNMSALKRFIMSDFDPDSAKILEDDFLYTYDWMQPVSMAISIGANTAKNMSDGDNKLSGLAGTAYNSLEGGLGTLTEQSVLQGLKSAAEGYPGQTVTDKVMDILSDIPSSFIPTASNQIRQLTDNARRETYDPNKLQQSLNRAQTKIPGLAGNLPQQSDTLGRPKETYQDNNIFNVMFNPGFASRYKLSPEAKLIVGLIEETGDETLAPRAPSKSITIDGVSVKMTTEEYARMQQYQGEETRKRLEKINPNASLKGRINKVEDALDKGGKKARDKLKGEMK